MFKLPCNVRNHKVVEPHGSRIVFAKQKQKCYSIFRKLSRIKRSKDSKSHKSSRANYQGWVQHREKHWEEGLRSRSMPQEISKIAFENAISLHFVVRSQANCMYFCCCDAVLIQVTKSIGKSNYRLLCILVSGGFIRLPPLG